MERHKNAECLARSLSKYLPAEEANRSRGRVRDKRICQLSAAFKYIVHLENAMASICEKSNLTLPDDCKLVSSYLNSNASTSFNDLSTATTAESSAISLSILNENIEGDYSDRSIDQNHLIHESSTISAAALSITACLNAKAASLSLRSVENVKENLKNFDASPIQSVHSHFLNETESSYEENNHENNAMRRANKRAFESNEQQDRVFSMPCGFACNDANEMADVNNNSCNRNLNLHAPKWDNKENSVTKKPRSERSGGGAGAGASGSSCRAHNMNSDESDRSGLETKSNYFLRSASRLNRKISTNNITATSDESSLNLMNESSNGSSSDQCGTIEFGTQTTKKNGETVVKKKASPVSFSSTTLTASSNRCDNASMEMSPSSPQSNNLDSCRKLVFESNEDESH